MALDKPEKIISIPLWPLVLPVFTFSIPLSSCSSFFQPVPVTSNCMGSFSQHPPTVELNIPKYPSTHGLIILRVLYHCNHVLLKLFLIVFQFCPHRRSSTNRSFIRPVLILPFPVLLSYFHSCHSLFLSPLAVRFIPLPHFVMFLCSCRLFLSPMKRPHPSLLTSLPPHHILSCPIYPRVCHPALIFSSFH